LSNYGKQKTHDKTSQENANQREETVNFTGFAIILTRQAPLLAIAFARFN
jgi:hypothetical protein